MNPEMPTISIVIPVFNRLDYLDQAIDSALAQSHRPIEVLVVDDGSQVDIAGHVAKHGGAVRFLRRENGGPAAARNSGLQQCTGEYALFLDDDDCLTPHALATLLKALERVPGATWAAGGYLYVDADGRPTGQEHRPVLADGDLSAAMICGNPIGAPLAVLVHAETVRKIGGFDEDRQLQTVEDYDLWIRLARQSPVALADAIIARYRRHAHNATGNKTRHLDARLELLAKHRKLAGELLAKTYDAAEAAVHREYGDVCYLSGMHAEARKHWRMAARRGGLAPREWRIRAAKSLLPPPISTVVRQGVAVIRQNHR